MPSLARAPMRLLLGYLRPHRRGLAAGAGLMFVGGLVNLAQPLAVKRLLDGVTGGTSFAEPMLLLAALLVAGALIGAGGMYLLEATAESVVLDARRRLIDRLLRLRVGVMDRAEPGDLLSRVTGDTTQLRAAATTNIVDLVTGVFQIGGAIVLMARLDLVLLGVVALVLALLLGVTALLAGRIRDVSERTQAAVGRLGAVLERALGAFRTVKANGAERQQTATAHRAATQAWQHGRRAARWVSAAGVTTGLAVQLAFVIVLGVGGARVAAGDLTVSSLVAFLLYLFYLAGPVSQLAGGVTGLQTGLAAVGRIDAVVRLPAEDPDEQAEPNAEATQPVSVAFHSVSLRHRPEDPDVLTDVTLRIPATGLTALVGPSGAGKSTLLALVERFQDPTSGHVEVGDRDIRRWPLRELRARIGYVEQDAPVLFGTLRDNLLLGTPDASDDWIDDVLDQTMLTTLVRRLPQGVDTPIGHRGVTLSGGERQRVAIARALLRRPSLLLLDEPTSQLDAVNEQVLRDLTAHVARTTTVLMAAHRLSTVIEADRIVVLEAGRIRAVGTHQSLIDSDDLYRRLAQTQLLLGLEAPAAAVSNGYRGRPETWAADAGSLDDPW
ncbi:ABC transporter ATP-binding protein [Micromonospora sp. NPDC049175]|uniref:ABC transporter ATP-binding protein n=1 Tax=Micromonospora sp. NPDC049175 TaxID=3364266 RepID=UPI00371F7D7A